MKKLSTAQRKVLEVLAAGGTLAHITGRNPRAFTWSNGPGIEGTTVPTLRALKAAGYLAVIKEDWRGGKYTISDAGREALGLAAQAQEAGEGA